LEKKQIKRTKRTRIGRRVLFLALLSCLLCIFSACDLYAPQEVVSIEDPAQTLAVEDHLHIPQSVHDNDGSWQSTWND